MAGAQHDSDFVGSVPDLYERLLVPMIFAEAADLLAAEIARLDPTDVLEVAAGTGVLTRAVLRHCPAARVVATDLNAPMLAVAASRLAPETSQGRVSWQEADAERLELDPASFDVVACQFGVMFFPHRVQAFAQARRVLRPGGALVFNVWDSLATNDLARVVHEALLEAAPEAPLLFMERTPHGVHDEHQLRAELAEAGFVDVATAWVDGVSRSTAAVAAVAFCQGTPLRGMLAEHPSLDPASATRIAEQALLAHFGTGEIEGRIRSLQVIAS